VLTLSHLIFSFEPGLITSFQEDAVRSVTLGHFLWLFSRHEGEIARLDLVKAHDKLAPGKLRFRLDPKTLLIAKAGRTK
jgi:hypothetical protein